MKKFTFTKLIGVAVAIVGAVVMATPAPAAAAPLPTSYTISLVSQSVTDLDVEISGLAAGFQYEGTVDQYVYKIDWGDGTIETLDLDNVIPFSAPPIKTFGASWDGSHSYLVDGAYDITVSLYRSTNDTTKDSFTIQVNVDDGIEEPVEPDPVTVTIVKYVGDEHATPEGTGNASFAMASNWNAENLGAGSGSYELDADGFNGADPYEAVTSEMTAGADYSTNEVMNDTVGTSCEAGTPFALVGYTTGATLETAEAGDLVDSVSLTDILSDTYIIVWNEECVVEPPTSVSVQINKFVDGTQATAESADNAEFAMTAVWDSTSHSSGTSPYILGPNGFGSDTTPYQTATVEFNVGADYSTYETLDGSIVGESCDVDEPPQFALVGYTIGDTYEQAAGAVPTSEAPSFADLANDKYVIVWNESCGEPEVPPTTGDLVVHKNVVGTDGETDVSDDTTFTITLNGGDSTPVSEGSDAEFSDLEPGEYTIAELETSGYEFVGASPSLVVTIVAGETTDVTLTNKQLPVEPTGPGAIVIKKIVVDEDGHEIADGTLFTVNVGEEGSSIFSEIYDASFSDLEPGSYSVWENETSDYEFISMEPEVVTVNEGATTTVTITNRYMPSEEPTDETTGRLVVTKTVVNEAGDEMDDNTRFRVILNNIDGEVFSMEDPANYVDLAPGDYTLSEEDFAGYTLTSMSASTFEVVAGETTRIEVVNTKDGSGNSGAAGGRHGSHHRGNSGNSGGEVLGASTDDMPMCEAAISGYLKIGSSGDDVVKLQNFLNAELGLNLAVTGTFGPETLAAVHQLQKLHGDEILQPWVDLGLLGSNGESTGYVYKMTLWWINSKLCDSAEMPMPQLP